MTSSWLNSLVIWLQWSLNKMFKRPQVEEGYAIYIIISKNIRYLLWNRGVWRFFHDTYHTIEVQGIRCTHHLNHFCLLTDVNPHFTSPGCRYYFKINSWWPIVTSSTHGPAARLKWRHNGPLFPRVSMDAWCWFYAGSVFWLSYTSSGWHGNQLITGICDKRSPNVMMSFYKNV